MIDFVIIIIMNNQLIKAQRKIIHTSVPPRRIEHQQMKVGKQCACSMERIFFQIKYHRYIFINN